MHAFPCGTPILDFVGTLRARRNPRPLEMLTSPESLDAWFRESGVIDGGEACRPSDVTEAVALREAVHALLVARLTGADYDSGALAVVNRAAREPSAVPQLGAEGRRVQADPGQALSSLARQAIDVLSGPEGALLKECSRPECTQIYLDRSRGGRREWCAMDPCGNRVKAAAYRARKKAGASASPASAR
ncbi:CGNR zinc finger domain-containing protein [Streptacidiphilus griseoplanus]|uniref:CGNR zinc finger domain-containing protein n=1 Tax=Peterkaempfera griseoplana TaxID=66896 RepID=UPI00099ED2B1|nr:CGNR zinc finger domain-containing protein [Peterkaempfera griseoplana]